MAKKKRSTATPLWVDDAVLIEDPSDGLLHDCTPDCPERDMMRALLEEAILGARCGDAETLAWFASDETTVTESGFWFLEVCGHLGLDPDAVRSAVAEMPPLERWHYRGRSRPSSPALEVTAVAA